jgi:hypothetical protein
LLDWTGRLRREYPTTDFQHTAINQLYPKFALLFADNDFIPVFGFPFDEFDPATLKPIWQDLQFNCTKDPFLRAKAQGLLPHPAFDTLLFSNPRQIYSGSFAIASVVHAVRTIRELRSRLSASKAEKLPAIAQSYDHLEQKQLNAKRGRCL